MKKQKLATSNKAVSLKKLLLLSETSFDSNLDANSSFWLINNKKEKISNVKNLEN